RLLDEFNIGCTACSAGSCLLKDIVEVHNLSPEEERLLMHGIAKIIYSGQEVEVPGIGRKPRPAGAPFSPPMKKLVDEHVLIKRFLAMLPFLTENLDVGTEDGRKFIMDCVEFIRLYADKLHHAKEEEILFAQFDRSSEIIGAMLEDHTQARAHVREIIAGTEKGDRISVQDHLSAYGELLAGHIKREDEILYPWMDRNLSTTQIGILFAQFNTADEKSGDVPRRSRKFVVSLEQLFQKKEVLQ
ncbi:MAG: hemerythrin domain-containing protein, partial [Candidatus Latescibacterota bacterium]